MVYKRLPHELSSHFFSWCQLPDFRKEAAVLPLKVVEKGMCLGLGSEQLVLHQLAVTLGPLQPFKDCDV